MCDTVLPAVAKSARATLRSGSGLSLVGHVGSALTAHITGASLVLQSQVSLFSVVCVVTWFFIASLVHYIQILCRPMSGC